MGIQAGGSLPTALRPLFALALASEPLQGELLPSSTQESVGFRGCPHSSVGLTSPLQQGRTHQRDAPLPCKPTRGYGRSSQRGAQSGSWVAADRDSTAGRSSWVVGRCGDTPSTTRECRGMVDDRTLSRLCPTRRGLGPLGPYGLPGLMEAVGSRLGSPCKQLSVVIGTGALTVSTTREVGARGRFSGNAE